MIKRIKITGKKLLSAWALLSTEFILLMLMVFISLTLLIVLIKGITYDKENAFDLAVFNFLVPYINNSTTAVMKFFTFFGSHKFLIPAWFAVFGWCFFVLKKKFLALKLFIIAASNLLLMFALKGVFNRPRPVLPLLGEVHGLSFPSGHAYMCFVFFGLNAFFIYRNISNRWLRWSSIIMLMILIIVIGISRIYLRVHYASDVVAGYCIGLISLVLHLWIIKKIERFTIRKIQKPT